MQLEPMTSDEFEVWAPKSRNQYAIDKVRANGFTQKEAEALAMESFTRILPDGYNSKDNFLFTVKSSESELLGYLWYCLRGADNNRKAWLCDILVEEKHRGKGVGRKTMELLEEDVRSKGICHIGLHVFAFNSVARSLYESLGYQTTDLSMEKSLT